MRLQEAATIDLDFSIVEKLILTFKNHDCSLLAIELQFMMSFSFLDLLSLPNKVLWVSLNLDCLSLYHYLLHLVIINLYFTTVP